MEESVARVENLDDEDEVVASYLADVDSTRGTETRVGDDGAPVFKAGQHLRSGYEQEHGAVTPLDTREAKRIY
jgi:hypothetical protein